MARYICLAETSVREVTPTALDGAGHTKMVRASGIDVEKRISRTLRKSNEREGEFQKAARMRVLNDRFKIILICRVRCEGKSVERN